MDSHEFHSRIRELIIDIATKMIRGESSTDGNMEWDDAFKVLSLCREADNLFLMPSTKDDEFAVVAVRRLDDEDDAVEFKRSLTQILKEDTERYGTEKDEQAEHRDGIRHSLGLIDVWLER